MLGELSVVAETTQLEGTMPSASSAMSEGRAHDELSSLAEQPGHRSLHSSTQTVGLGRATRPHVQGVSTWVDPTAKRTVDQQLRSE
jgi:hypothetical protein